MTQAFSQADPKQFKWQTQHFYIAKTEKELFSPILNIGEDQSILEIGCGDGANFVHFLPNSPKRVVGLDPSSNRLEFAKSKFPRAEFISGTGENLPLDDQAFDLVVIRDVLHHASSPVNLLKEASRVCRPGGLLFVLEPNGRNPIMNLWSRVAGFDRGILKNNPDSLTAMLARANLTNPTFHFFQAFPISRIIFHYRLSPLRSIKLLAPVVRMLESMIGSLIPSRRHAYIGMEWKKPS